MKGNAPVIPAPERKSTEDRSSRPACTTEQVQDQPKKKGGKERKG